jgi:tetratricopeptide (TPR) repeat protein
MISTLDNFKSPILSQKFTTPSLDYKIHSKQLEEYVDLLFSYRKKLQETTVEKTIMIKLVYDFLVIFNTITSIKKRNSNILQKVVTEEDLDEISTHDFDPTLSNSQRAKYHFLRGKVLNIFESYHPGALDNLSKSVKLDPYSIEAWKELGECFWYKGDLEQSQNCFEYILDLNENQPQALVLLSMVKRRAGSVASDFVESIQLCKKALEMDPGFIEAWVGLGSTYMALYFKLTHNINDLYRALEAYDKAIGSTNPDLYYSRAIIHQYLENVEDAIVDLKKAAVLDKSLETRCKHAIVNMKKYLRELVKGLDSKVFYIDEVGLDERGIVTFKEKLNKDIVGEVTISELKQGKNLKLNLRLVVLRCINRYHDNTGRYLNLKRTFLALDKNGDFIALSVFNIKPNTIQVSDVITIMNPFEKLVQEKKLVRVDDPRQCWLNDKRITADDMLAVEIAVESSFL